MFTGLTIRNFKVFEEVTIELGNPVVFVGPNNSGKTTALQALSLWELGLRRWNEKRSGDKSPQQRPGVTINRRDLLAVPVPEAILLWRDAHVMRRGNQKIRLEVVVDGAEPAGSWSCGLEFEYANPESFYCRPLRLDSASGAQRMPIPPAALRARVAFLPPLSGLADQEFMMQRGQIDVLIGQGRTAEVLRNLLWQVWLQEKHSKGDFGGWTEIQTRVASLFGVDLQEPHYSPDTSQITVSYKDSRRQELDLSCAGRGFHQTVLLATYFAANPKSVLLLDEPDAHLEVLRQRQTYQMISALAAKYSCQLIVSSHSEVLLNEAAGRDVVVAFLGSPHRIDDRGSQVMKSLRDIGFDQYYQAVAKGWALYLEGSTDLAILGAFAMRLRHPAAKVLSEPFVHYIANQPMLALEHYHGLREAKPDLQAFCLTDRLDRAFPPAMDFPRHMWRRREIENYLCQPETLVAFARDFAGGPLLAASFEQAMRECIEDSIGRRALNDSSDSYWTDVKATDQLLHPLFAEFHSKLGVPTLTGKSDYHRLALFVPEGLIDPEITDVLDAILAVAQSANATPGTGSR